MGYPPQPWPRASKKRPSGDCLIHMQPRTCTHNHNRHKTLMSRSSMTITQHFRLIDTVPEGAFTICVCAPDWAVLRRLFIFFKRWILLEEIAKSIGFLFFLFDGTLSNFYAFNFAADIEFSSSSVCAPDWAVLRRPFFFAKDRYCLRKLPEHWLFWSIFCSMGPCPIF